MKPASCEEWYDVHRLFVRYTTSLDACDVDAVADCFTEDGWLESPVLGRFEGRAVIREFALRTEKVRATRGGQFRHVVSNLSVEIQGDTGRATCYLLDFLTTANRTQLLSPGEYVCGLARVEDGWRFTSRTVLMDRRFPPPDEA